MEEVTIVNIKSNTETRIPILCKKTVIVDDGATGKSYFYSELTRRDLRPSLKLEYSGGDVNYINSLQDLNGLDRNTLLVSDEIPIIANKGILSSMLALPNPFLLICRKIDFAGDTDIRSVIRLSFDGNTITTSQYFDSNIVSIPKGSYTHIVCESLEDKSEFLVLRKLLNLEVIPAGGNTRIYSKIRHIMSTYVNPRILVFADLSAFSGPAIFMHNRIPSVIYELYDYPSFEALLFYSKLVQSLGINIQVDYFSQQTMETFYEKELELVTRGTKLEYKHRPSTVSSCFYKQCKDCCDEQDPNTIGKVLFNKYGIGLMAWYYANYTQFLETYDYLIEDKSKIPEEQALAILDSIKDIYLGDLRYKCFDD